MWGQIKGLVRNPPWRLCMEELPGGGCRALCSALCCCPQDHWGRMNLAMLINELPCRAQLLCCQYLRDGNLLMLLATRISIRAPFMWSPRFTWIWNAANKPHLLHTLESNSCSLLLAFIHPAGSCIPTAPSWNWAELDYRRDQRPQAWLFPSLSGLQPTTCSFCLTAG